jgi:hypothetical protein
MKCSKETNTHIYRADQADPRLIVQQFESFVDGFRLGFACFHQIIGVPNAAGQLFDRVRKGQDALDSRYRQKAATAG